MWPTTKISFMTQQQVESAAYHEAAHMTAAIVQGMPIRLTGVHIGEYGHGCSDYFDRPVGDLGLSNIDEVERKRTIIALFAAHAAQVRFYPDCDRTGWGHDLTKMRKLMLEMHPGGNQQAQDDLEARAKKLVNAHWGIIEGLAKTLLSKPLVPMLGDETAWGIGPFKRTVSGAELVEFFADRNIKAKIVNDDVRNYDSTRDQPPYDSLA
jgi:hypothetical protein